MLLLAELLGISQLLTSDSMLASGRAIFDLDQLLIMMSRLFVPSSPEDFILAEITKLSVGQALDKLRGTDAPKSRMTQLDGKIGALDEEMRRMRATTRRLERDQRVSSTSPHPQEANARGPTKLVISAIIIGIIIVISMFVWSGLARAIAQSLTDWA
jgi:hypothetical protein